MLGFIQHPPELIVNTDEEMHPLYERLYEQERPLLRKGEPLRVPELATAAQRLAYRRWRWEHKDRPELEVHLAGVRKQLQAQGKDIIFVKATGTSLPPLPPETRNAAVG